MNILLTHIFQSSLVFALLTLFYYFLLSKDLRHRSNRLFLLLVPLLSILIPFVQITIPIQQVVEPYIYQSSNPSTSAQVAATGSTNRFALHPLGIIYFLGIGVIAIRFFIGMAMLMQLKFHGRIKKSLVATIVKIQGTKAPFSFMNTIYIPDRAFTTDEYNQIIQHELVHIQQKHSWDLLYCHLCCVIFWFNPFVWWHLRLVKENHEFLADRRVINNGYDTVDYQYHLIRSVSGQQISKLSLYSHFSNAQLLKKRIIMLNQGKLLPWRSLRYVLVLPFIALAMFASGQIKTVNVFHDANIYQAYGGSIPNNIVLNKTIYVDDNMISLSDFEGKFAKRNSEWLVECAIIYSNKAEELFIYTSKDRCSQLMPTPPPPPSAPIAPAPPPATGADLPPPHEAMIQTTSAPEPPIAPIAPPAPPVPTHWNSLENWGDLDARKDYLHEMELQGATFWLNDEKVEPEELESIPLDAINNTDVSARMNNRKQRITIKVYTKQ